jgi:hypothetical protein
MGDRGSTYRVLVGRPEGKSQLEKARRRWEDNIKIDYQGKMKWGGMDRIDLAHDKERWRALVNVFHKVRGTSCLSVDLLAFQEELCSMELVS